MWKSNSKIKGSKSIPRGLEINDSQSNGDHFLFLSQYYHFQILRAQCSVAIYNTLSLVKLFICSQWMRITVAPGLIAEALSWLP